MGSGAAASRPVSPATTASDAVYRGSDSGGKAASQGGADCETGPEFSDQPDAPHRRQQAVVAPPAEPGVARAEPVSEREVITRLQIFLDQRSFSPGKIDGRWGEFVAKALQRYQRANALPATGQIDGYLQQELQHIFPIYTTYVLTRMTSIESATSRINRKNRPRSKRCFTGR